MEHPETSLLEALRRKLVEESIIEPTTKQAARRKMDLILRHSSEFPSKLRAAIEEASYNEAMEYLSLQAIEHLSLQTMNPNTESAILRRKYAKTILHRIDPQNFLARVYEAIKVFFLGVLYRATDAQRHHHWILGWHGLDHTMDTQDEAELAIRCFPQILTQTTHLKSTGLQFCMPIHMLLVDAKTVQFIPLFAKLGMEFGKFPSWARGGLFCGPKNLSLVTQLLYNTMAATAENSRAQLRGVKPNTEAVDATSLQVLTRLRKMGLVHTDDIKSLPLIIDLFNVASYREMTFVEQRLRFLIDCHPNLLQDCGNGNNLLWASCAWNNFFREERFCRKRVEVRIFEIIFECGMTYYPLQIGHIFHDTSFQVACERMGSPIVKEMVREKLSGTLGHTRLSNKNQNYSIEQTDGKEKKNITLQTLVIAAASNSKISLDGVYTLIRLDPTIALMPQGPHPTTY
eukprot:CAMPEP_0116137712 /NCGR_PEP_ID=MMETSP0329-20121206/12388_1 /TAXON_ID=697910 /ORGANISM="Pseudo-nitzschia arenysensis, Strain B593" /LENGTH=457 /DNA_ID=CAMNT_0003632633 /DNA_START=207 /DNA_END=1580 /DNA_ORIENTATION=+